MKLLRHGAKGAEKPALLDTQGQLRDLSKYLPDIVNATLTPHSLQRLHELDPNALPKVAAQASSRHWAAHWASFRTYWQQCLGLPQSCTRAHWLSRF